MFGNCAILVTSWMSSSIGLCDSNLPDHLKNNFICPCWILIPIYLRLKLSFEVFCAFVSVFFYILLTDLYWFIRR